MDIPVRQPKPKSPPKPSSSPKTPKAHKPLRANPHSQLDTQIPKASPLFITNAFVHEDSTSAMIKQIDRDCTT